MLNPKCCLEKLLMVLSMVNPLKMVITKWFLEHQAGFLTWCKAITVTIIFLDNQNRNCFGRPSANSWYEQFDNHAGDWRRTPSSQGHLTHTHVNIPIKIHPGIVEEARASPDANFGKPCGTWATTGCVLTKLVFYIYIYVFKLKMCCMFSTYLG